MRPSLLSFVVEIGSKNRSNYVLKGPTQQLKTWENQRGISRLMLKPLFSMEVKQGQAALQTDYARNFRETKPARPKMPVPNRARVEGSGTGEVAAVAEKVTMPESCVLNVKFPGVMS